VTVLPTTGFAAFGAGVVSLDQPRAHAILGRVEKLTGRQNLADFGTLLNSASMLNFGTFVDNRLDFSEKTL
jgi:hypothetical protein